MRNNTILTIILLASMFANALLLCIHNSVVESARSSGYDSGYEVGFDEGFDKGVMRGEYYVERTLYGICEEEDQRAEFPAGFCAGVDQFLAY